MRKRVTAMGRATAASVRRILRDSSGAIAILFGFLLMILLIAAGGAIDLARYLILRTELRQMVDGAVLGASAIIGNNTQALLTGTANGYIAAQPITSVDANVTVVESTYLQDIRSYRLTLRGTIDTTLLRLAGIDTLSATATAQSLRALPGPVELVIVADYTISMSTNLGWGVGDGSRLGALQAATSNLIDALREYPDVSIGIVPFSTHINVDPDLWRTSRTVGNNVVWSDNEEGAKWLSLLGSTQIRDWTGCIGVRRQNLRTQLGEFVAPAGERYPRFSNPAACQNVGSARGLPTMIPLRQITAHATLITDALARRGGGQRLLFPQG